MNRSKLRELRVDLPLLPTTAVGSLPKPEALLKAHADFARGQISHEESREAERAAVKWWIRKQEELGLDVLVDGEMYRGDMVAYFAEHLSGFEAGGLVRSYGNRYYHKPIIVGEVIPADPITVEWWSYAQGLTARPVKGVLTGPYTLMDWSFNEFYPSRREACLALAAAVRQEAEGLIGAGCKIIQIDEPGISARPEELALAIEAMNIVTSDLPAYFIAHVCYGDFESIYPEMLDLGVDNFDLEMSNSRAGLLSLFRKTPFTKDISYGVVDVHSHLVEGPAVVEERLRNGLEVLPIKNVWVDPDCGLKTRTVEEAIAKLRAVVLAAKAVRRYGGEISTPTRSSFSP